MCEGLVDDVKGTLDLSLYMFMSGNSKKTHLDGQNLVLTSVGSVCLYDEGMRVRFSPIRKREQDRYVIKYVWTHESSRIDSF